MDDLLDNYDVFHHLFNLQLEDVHVLIQRVENGDGGDFALFQIHHSLLNLETTCINERHQFMGCWHQSVPQQSVSIWRPASPPPPPPQLVDFTS